MTTETRNEAAERLRAAHWDAADTCGIGADRLKELLDEALAAERRATVQRIHNQLNGDLVHRDTEGNKAVYLNELEVLLDKEAAQ